MTTKWAHLPNAKYIDAVLASVKAYPDTWMLPGIKTYPFGYVYEAWDEDWEPSWQEAWDTVQEAAMAAVQAAGQWGAVRDAILALIAYNDCAHLLTSNPDEVLALAKLGVPAASLLFPACLVFNETNELTSI